MKDQDSIAHFNVNEIDFHPVLKDIENMFWFFLLSMRTLSDYDVQNIVRAKNSAQKDYQSFNQMLDKFNRTVDLRIEKTGKVVTSKLNILKEMIFMGKAMVILIYELLLVSKYIEIIKEDEEFQFLKYVRNGAAHDNKFDLKYRFGKNKGKWMINEDRIIKWNNMKINRKLQGTIVFNDFISISTVFLLAKYFSERLKKIDNDQK